MNERTKRIGTLWLFLILGPLLTFLILGMVLYRRLGLEASAIERSICTFSRYPVQIQKTRFIRPGQIDFFGMRLNDPSNPEEAILFCPAVRTVRRKGLPSNTELLEIFPDQIGLSQSNSGSESSVFVPLDASVAEGGRKTNEAFEFQSSTAFMARIPKELSEYQFWSIPKLYVRYSQRAEVQTWFMELLRRAESRRRDLIFFSIGELIFVYSDSDFKQEIAQFKVPSRSQAFKNSTTRPIRGIEGIDASLASIQRWISRWNKESRTSSLTDLQGIYCDLVQRRRFDLGFCFSEIPITRPVALTFLHEKGKAPDGSQSRTFFYLDTNVCPFPATFAACFNPFFYHAGDQSWFTGFISGELGNREQEKKPESIWKINNFHLRSSSLESFLKQATIARITGTIMDLYLEKATIRDGVFSGNGSLFLTEGYLDKKILLQLKKKLNLKFDPEHALSNHFKDEEVPYDEMAFQFTLLPKGVCFDSNYPQRIVGCYKRDGFQYAFYLPEKETERTVPYPEIFSALAPEKGSASFWSRFYRDALNHLPLHP